MLHRAGSYSPAKLKQKLKSSDVSDLQAPIDGVRAVMMTSDVAWVLQRAGFHLPFRPLHHSKFSDVSAVQSPIDGGRPVMMTSV